MQVHMYVKRSRQWLMKRVEAARLMLEKTTGCRVAQSDVILDCVEEVLGKAKLDVISEAPRSEGLLQVLEKFRGDSRHHHLSFASEDQWILEFLKQWAAAQQVGGKATSLSSEITRFLKISILSQDQYAVTARRVVGLEIDTSKGG